MCGPIKIREPIASICVRKYIMDKIVKNEINEISHQLMYCMISQF